MTINAAEYYRSIDDADAYFANQIHNVDWTGATETTKEKGLLAAGRAIESVRFRGLKVPIFAIKYDADGNDLQPTQAAIETADALQVREWPRDGLDFAPTTASTVQGLAAYTTAPTAGNITVTITLADGTTFTTADIAFDAIAATVQTAIDVAATAAAVAGWTNGDIAVAGGPMTTTAMTLTMSGVSVADEAHSARPVVAGDATFLVDGVLATVTGSSTVTGQCPDRIFFAQCEEAISLISGKLAAKEFENLRLTSNGIATTRVSTDPSRMPPAHTAHFFTSADAWKYIQEFLDEDNKSFDLDRA